MQIFDLHNHSEISTIPADTVMVLGYFDGVHMGHRALFAEAKKLAINKKTVCVWTFDSMPRANSESLTTTEEKLRLFRECGVDFVVLEKFEDMRSTDGKEFFAKYLINKFSPSAVVCGFNFHFGKDGAYTADDFDKMAGESGIVCAVVPEQIEGGQTVSSTRIRGLLVNGKIEEANRLLGSPYSITSVIEHGVRIGRKMGVRTINQRLPEDKICPMHGVYCCTVTLYSDGGEHTYGGVCNIGSRPTVNDDQSDVTLETHIFDFDGEIYGKCVTTKLYSLLREEQKFTDLDSLKEAIGKDSAKAAELLKNIL